MRSLDDRGSVSPLVTLVLSLLILLAGEFMLPAFTLLKDIRRTALRLEECVLLLSAVSRLAAFSDPELPVPAEQLLPPPVRMRAIPVGDGRVEVTLQVVKPDGFLDSFEEPRVGRGPLTLYLTPTAGGVQ